MERADGMGRKKVPSGPWRAGREASWEQGCGCAGTLPEASFLWGCLGCGQAGEGQGAWGGGKMDYETLQRPELEPQSSVMNDWAGRDPSGGSRPRRGGEAEC